MSEQHEFLHDSEKNVLLHLLQKQTASLVYMLNHCNKLIWYCNCECQRNISSVSFVWRNWWILFIFFCIVIRELMQFAWTWWDSRNGQWMLRFSRKKTKTQQSAENLGKTNFAAISSKFPHFLVLFKSNGNVFQRLFQSLLCVDDKSQNRKKKYLTEKIKC